MTTGKRLLAKVAPYVKLVRGLSHPYRVAILYLLAHDPMWERDLVIHLGKPQNLVAHHLKEMTKGGWLKREKVGRYVTYTLNDKAFRELPKLLVDTPFGRQLFVPKKE